MKPEITYPKRTVYYNAARNYWSLFVDRFRTSNTMNLFLALGFGLLFLIFRIIPKNSKRQAL